MEQIKVLYVDNEPDNYLTRYLRESYDNKDFDDVIKYNYEQLIFNGEDTLEDLINYKIIKESNIIIMDSSLFDGSNKDSVFSGEDFKVIFKKIFSFTEVIVITQHNIKDASFQTVEKFKARKVTRRGDERQESKQHYDRFLKPQIEMSTKNIIEIRKIIEKMRNSNDYNIVLVEKLNNLLIGISDYNELDKKDINKIISIFKEIQEYYE